MTQYQETRAALRALLREARRQLPADERKSAETQATRHLVQFASELQAGNICMYSATDAELDLSSATQELRNLGWRTFLPVLGAERQMDFAEWETEEQLEPNKFGILQPSEPSELMSASQMDLLVVPCVGLDAAGNRLGFGAGFYDRALEGVHRTHTQSSGRTQNRRPLLIGCVFDIQIVEDLRAEPWDVPMHYVLSESHITESHITESQNSESKTQRQR